jgi:hypothetical protein
MAVSITSENFTPKERIGNEAFGNPAAYAAFCLCSGTQGISRRNSFVTIRFETCFSLNMNTMIFFTGGRMK